MEMLADMAQKEFDETPDDLKDKRARGSEKSIREMHANFMKQYDRIMARRQQHGLNGSSVLGFGLPQWASSIPQARTPAANPVAAAAAPVRNLLHMAGEGGERSGLLQEGEAISPEEFEQMRRDEIARRHGFPTEATNEFPDENYDDYDVNDWIEPESILDNVRHKAGNAAMAATHAVRRAGRAIYPYAKAAVDWIAPPAKVSDLTEGRDDENYSDYNMRQLWREQRKDHDPDGNHYENFRNRANELLQNDSIDLKERQGFYNSLNSAEKNLVQPPTQPPSMMDRAADYARKIGEYVAPIYQEGETPPPDIFDHIGNFLRRGKSAAENVASDAAEEIAERAERERIRLQSAAAKVSDVIAPRKKDDDDDWGRPKPQQKFTPQYDPKIHEWKPSDMNPPNRRLTYLSDSDDDDRELSPVEKSMRNMPSPDEEREELARAMDRGRQQAGLSPLAMAMRATEYRPDASKPMSPNPKAKILQGVTGINKMKLKDFQDIRHIENLIPEERGALQNRAEELFADRSLPYGQRAATRRFLGDIGLKNLDELPEDKDKKIRGGTFGLAGKNFYSDEPDSDIENENENEEIENENAEKENPFSDMTNDEMRELNQDSESLRHMSPDEREMFEMELELRNAQILNAHRLAKIENDRQRELTLAGAREDRIDPEIAKRNLPFVENLPKKYPPEIAEMRRANEEIAARRDAEKADIRNRYKQNRRIDFSNFAEAMATIPPNRLESEPAVERRALGRRVNDFIGNRKLDVGQRTKLKMDAEKAGLAGLDSTPETLDRIKDRRRENRERERLQAAATGGRYISPFEAAEERMRRLGFLTTRKK
jgi:hypothetical protein